MNEAFFKSKTLPKFGDLFQLVFHFVSRSGLFIAAQYSRDGGSHITYDKAILQIGFICSDIYYYHPRRSITSISIRTCIRIDVNYVMWETTLAGSL